MKKQKWIGIAAASLFALLGASASAKPIVHDAEYQVLLKQHGEAWAEEDLELDKRLAALEKKYGKKPNIIHLMWDDSGYGDVGSPILTRLHGIDTPNIAQMAEEGLTFTRMYTEPSCTPTRAAALTGRHPIRSGMFQVIFPIHGLGLPKQEVTIAEILSKNGYSTAFFGKAHQGDIEESYLHNQGFDEALFSTYNQFASQFFNETGEISRMTIGYSEDQWDQHGYAIDKEFRYKGEDIVWAVEGKKGEPGKRWNKDLSVEEQLRFTDETHARSLQYIRDHANDEKPFYLDYWFHGPNFVEKFTDRGREANSARDNAFGDFVEHMDELVSEVIAEVKKAGIEENTLIILMADNGPMKEIFPDEAFQAIFSGGKGSFLEGGIRVPAFAWWPGTIESGSVAGDILHVSDLFTTFARLGGATDDIPRNRVIDGIDQTALLLNGDGHSRRDYVHVYAGPNYAATVKQQFKRHWMSSRPGLVGKSFFDLYKDPREEKGMMGQFLWAWEPFDSIKGRHEAQMKKYKNTPPRKAPVFTGLSNYSPKK
ncbi:sulfatase-like hydrolase/transferase [Agaribacterium sp. ZY112]|uniref:sulfatase-like hydrolase/transferase n=1 Tax=Agaribacterium sp. ZY112 TaxID=3233574 RepID=UPI0035244CF4